MSKDPQKPSGPDARPAGADPRLKLDRDALAAASLTAMPQVARTSSTGDTLVLLAGMAGILALGGITFFSLGKTPVPRPAVRPAPAVQAPPPADGMPPIDPSLNPPVEAPVPAAPIVTQPGPPPSQAEATTTRAPAMIIDNSLPPSGTPASGDQATVQAAAGKTLNANDQFLTAHTGNPSQKAQMIGDPAKVVPQGAVIPAVLETAINSDLPGYARAIVSRDIRAFDGTTVLIPRGSRLVGQYKSGLASGETRAFIIWDRLIRPDGVSVSLASPATDDLGQAGMTGKVDSHFAKRFGSAILLSIVNGLAGSIGNRSGSTIVIGTSTDAQGAVGEALSNDIRIPPTIKVPQGAPIQVFAARDLDFDLGQ